MKVAVLVNNYNYGRFLGDCLASVLAQTHPADEIVVVDDGSTDDSRTVLAEFEAGNGRLRIIAKPNGGQLSAFNAGFLASRADVLFFLDSDDMYHPEYIERVLEGFSSYPETEVFYSSYLKFFNDGTERACLSEAGELPAHFLQAVYLHRFCGQPTSMIAIRREALSNILPYGDEQAWRVSADDVLVFLAAARRLRRRQIPDPLVRYRIHGGNHYQGKRPSRQQRLQRASARALLLKPYREHFESLPAPGRLAIYREEVRQSPRAAKEAYRLLLLVFRLPVHGNDRVGLLLAWARWLLTGRVA